MKTIQTIIFLTLIALNAYMFGLNQIEKPERIEYRKVEVPKEKEVPVYIETKTPVYIEKEVVVRQECPYQELADAFKIAKESGTYEYGVYDCSEFSRRLIKELGDRDIWATISYGNSPRGEMHAWVAIQVEPQTGSFIRPDEGYILDPEIKKFDIGYK